MTWKLRIAVWIAALIAPEMLAGAAFDTVINVDFGLDAVPSSIGSNTQLNVTGSASLPESFQAGDPDGTSTNVEVNFSGIRAGHIDAYAGSTMNISDGAIWGTLKANAGSTINISGDTILHTTIGAKSGSKVHISGGSISSISVQNGSLVEVSGGKWAGDFYAETGSDINISGGIQGESGNYSQFLPGSQLMITGGDFQLNGARIEGLDAVGNSRAFNLLQTDVLSGIFSDGMPFLFSGQNGDQFSEGTISLQLAEIPDVVPGSIDVTSQSTIHGIRHGQRITVLDEGVLPPYFKANSGSSVRVVGGTVSSHFEAVDTHVNILGGKVESSFNAFFGTVVEISGGVIGTDFAAMNGSEIRISGGQIGTAFNAQFGSDVHISGGAFGERFQSYEGSSVKILGGEFDDHFQVHAGSDLTIAGGSFGENFRAYEGSNIEFRGSQFLLDGEPIEGLVAGVPMLLTARDATFSGTLADGSPFSFYLGITDYERSPWWGGVWSYDFFVPGAMLSVTVVPEPTTGVLGVLVVLSMFLVPVRCCRGELPRSAPVLCVDWR